jgi:hypothetical protein
VATLHGDFCPVDLIAEYAHGTVHRKTDPTTNAGRCSSEVPITASRSLEIGPAALRRILHLRQKRPRLTKQYFTSFHGKFIFSYLDQ